MNDRISKISNDVQNRNCDAWRKLCEYVDQLAESGKDEFAPREVLGEELFSQIFTLPESIAKLKKVKKVWLYGSQLKRIPPEIGQMTSLEYFDPYTSYKLHWFPYEITNCKNLKESRISTRALYGNKKTRMGFPKLDNNPIRYEGNLVKCSICEKEIKYENTNQLWITLRIGTDTVPLLVNLCSKECELKLPKPPENYIQKPHKGGSNLKQPPTNYETRKKELEKRQNEDSVINKTNQQNEKLDLKNWKPLKLIRKIWEK